jgi:hypothetical protein
MTCVRGGAVCEGSASADPRRGRSGCWIGRIGCEGGDEGVRKRTRPEGLGQRLRLRTEQEHVV